MSISIFISRHSISERVHGLLYEVSKKTVQETLVRRPDIIMSQFVLCEDGITVFKVTIYSMTNIISKPPSHIHSNPENSL